MSLLLLRLLSEGRTQLCTPPHSVALVLKTATLEQFQSTTTDVQSGDYQKDDNFGVDKDEDAGED